MVDPQPTDGTSNAAPIPEWRLKGDWWDMCNCNIGCPCVFSSPPTLGYCEGVLTWLVLSFR